MEDLKKYRQKNNVRLVKLKKGKEGTCKVQQYVENVKCQVFGLAYREFEIEHEHCSLAYLI